MAVAIVGALSWTPQLYDILRPAQLSAKLISKFENEGTFNGRPGTLHFVKLVLCSSYQPYQVKDLTIRIKYSDESSPRPAKWQWARFSSWTMPDGTKKTLKLQPDSFLGFRTNLPKDEAVVSYLTFFSDKRPVADFDWLELCITQYDGTTKTIRVNQTDPGQLLFDDSIWTEAKTTRLINLASARAVIRARAASS
jgi:hypothetical protein